MKHLIRAAAKEAREIETNLRRDAPAIERSFAKLQKEVAQQRARLDAMQSGTLKLKQFLKALPDRGTEIPCPRCWFVGRTSILQLAAGDADTDAMRCPERSCRYTLTAPN